MEQPYHPIDGYAWAFSWAQGHILFPWTAPRSGAGKEPHLHLMSDSEVQAAIHDVFIHSGIQALALAHIALILFFSFPFRGHNDSGIRMNGPPLITKHHPDAREGGSVINASLSSLLSHATRSIPLPTLCVDPLDSGGCVSILDPGRF
jgi:hypothetical protein